jgi:hypothetical protein
MSKNIHSAEEYHKSIISQIVSRQKRHEPPTGVSSVKGAVDAQERRSDEAPVLKDRRVDPVDDTRPQFGPYGEVVKSIAKCEDVTLILTASRLSKITFGKR